jgi:hypothetical protein
MEKSLTAANESIIVEMEKKSIPRQRLIRTWPLLSLFSLSLFLWIIILPLTRQGMFIDGVFYAAIAKNLSLGYGSLWAPFYSQTDFTVFYDHPPLALYFQSLFFKILGQGYGTERVYALLMALGQLVFISYYWVKKHSTSTVHFGLLLLIWLLIPLNHLYISNHLEATLTLFTTFASLILFVPTKTKFTFFAQYSVSAASILIAFFCNGPTAFFPLMVPCIQSLTDKNRTMYEGIKKTGLLTALTLLFLTCFYLSTPEALINTKHYFNQQLLPAVMGSRQLDYEGIKHINVVYLYFRAYAWVSIFAFACLFIAAKMKGIPFGRYIKDALLGKEFLLFFTLSLISSLPSGVSHKQALNYIMPSAPFYALAMMSLCFPSCNFLFSYRIKKGFLYALTTASYAVFLVSLIALSILSKGFNRHQSMIEDIQYLTHYCKNNSIISASPKIYYHWYTGAYLVRHSMISMTPITGHHYYLTLKNELIPKHYHLVNVPLSFYKLAELDNAHSSID